MSCVLHCMIGRCIRACSRRREELHPGLGWSLTWAPSQAAELPTRPGQQLCIAVQASACGSADSCSWLHTAHIWRRQGPLTAV